MAAFNKNNPVVWLVLVLFISLFLGNLLVFRKLMDINYQNAPLPHPLAMNEIPAVPDDPTVVRIGVVSRFAPNTIYRLYQPIMDYLNANSRRHFKLVLSESYQDAARSLRTGEVQASFLGAWMCHQLPPDSDLMPVLMPVNSQGISRFNVVLITAENSPIKSLSDLKGRKVAVPSDQAFSGNWLQNWGLLSVGLAVADLDTIQHFQHHETVIWQVLRGDFDAGVVKENLARKYQKQGLRTVANSPAIPGPPLVICRKNQNDDVRELVKLLLDLDHSNARDQALMQSWTPEFAFGFIPVDEKAYQEDFLSDRTMPEETP